MISNAQELADLFKVLSSPSRVKMLELIKNRSLCVSILAKELNMTPAAVSQHMRILRSAKLAKGEKRGNYVHYQADNEKLKKWQKKIRLFFEPPLT
ncbi:ArsR/SmtB family transcription factor [Desulfonatronovibrio magnus]|uniref:ArsR/SmtB family transcription factor n=1 Tax=Desulfonatronovibrio magnus TaxID=698827 RepID=UPI001E31754F|nr:metalloregulator ArsR/SmtB family transcription factor [Desulfonatronovibrio magnus]